ncbi:MAG: cyclic nucleotide-binding domain-containing protein [Proteobacteria bacterium]|nr:cyclic nucleotide-binding domain-containing protein [Pseudomonadota bacterium]
MEQGIFAYIWRHSKPEQISILVVTVASFPFLYLALNLPKVIVNDAIDGKDFPREVMTFPFDQIPYLLVLCGALLGLLLVNGGFRMGINIYKGILAERMLRRLRYQLYERILRFPMHHFQKVSAGELASMITAEVEPLGEFIRDALALPVFQGGTMLTILFFMFTQDWKLGLAAVALIPVQAWVIPILQRQVNLLGKERVKRARKLAGRVGEAVSGIHDIHTHDTSAYSLAHFSHRLAGIFNIRDRLYRKKFLMKFTNNLLIALTPLLFYSVGGYLIIRGDLTLGALVAVLAAYANFTTPWKELLKYYQRMADARIKYGQLIEQFQPTDMLDPSLQRDRPQTIEPITGPLSLQHVTLADEDGIETLTGVTFQAEPGSRIAIVAGGSDRDKLAHVLARLLVPTRGKVMIGEDNLSTMHEAVIGSRIGYAGPDSYIFDGTIAHNVLYGLKHAPTSEPEMDDKRRRAYKESVASGNSTDDIDAEWIDFKLLGMSGTAELKEWWVRVIQALEIEDALYTRALNMSLDAESHPGLADGVLQARERIARRLEETPDLAGLVHAFDFDTYNVNASVGENLMFGEPVTAEFAFENLGENPYVRRILEECGLTLRFQEIGLKAAATMVDMFNDLSPDEPLFEEYSFVNEEALQALKHVSSRAKREGLDALSEAERSHLMSLTCQLIVGRHRLGLIEDDMQRDLVRARKAFRDNLPEDARGAIAFFDRDSFNSHLSLQCNLLMGRVNLARPQADEKVNDLILEVLNEMGLRQTVVLAATNAEVGIGGRRMALIDRQKIALARSLLKRPDILIINEALNAIEREARDRIRRNIYELLPDTTVIWIDSEMPDVTEFDQVLVLRNGRITERIVEQVAEEAPAVEEPAEEGEGPTTLDTEASALAAVPLFSRMEPARLKLLAFASRRLIFDAGEELFHQGDPGDAAYVILDGEADVVIGEGDKETVINRAGSNELVGEMALLSTTPRSATLRAVAELTVLRLKKETFLELMERDPHIAAEVARRISDRLLDTMEKLQKAA